MDVTFNGRRTWARAHINGRDCLPFFSKDCFQEVTNNALDHHVRVEEARERSGMKFCTHVGANKTLFRGLVRPNVCSKYCSFPGQSVS